MARTAFNPWPWGIVAAFVLFIGGLVTLIVTATSGRNELVTADYYEQELRYQTQINRLNRTQALATPVRVVLDPGLRKILVHLPAEHLGRGLRGHIHLYRPSAAGLDRHVDLRPSTQGTQVLDASDLQPGLWKVRVSWTAAGQDYFAEESVRVATPTPGEAP